MVSTAAATAAAFTHFFAFMVVMVLVVLVIGGFRVYVEFGFFFEAFLASWSTEIVGSALVHCFPLCCFLIYIHVAN